MPMKLLGNGNLLLFSGGKRDRIFNNQPALTGAHQERWRDLPVETSATASNIAGANSGRNRKEREFWKMRVNTPIGAPL